MLRRKLLSSAERLTYKFNPRHGSKDREEKVLRKNSENNWISGVGHVLGIGIWHLWHLVPKYRCKIILEVAATYGHIKLMKLIRDKCSTGDFVKPFAIACRHGRIRAMAVIKSWLMQKIYNLGFAEAFPKNLQTFADALLGDQPAAIVLLNRWSKMSDSALLELLKSEFDEISHLRLAPARINKFLKRRGLCPIGIPNFGGDDGAMTFILPRFGDFFHDMVLRMGPIQECESTLSRPARAAPVA